MDLQLVAAPAVEPVSLAEAKTHCRVEISDDDSLINALITAARELCEAYTGRLFITQTWDFVRWTWPSGTIMRLPRPPLQSVTYIHYTDHDAVTSTFASSNYLVEVVGEPGRVVLLEGKSWPTVALYPAAAIWTRFVAGYGDTGSDVPGPIRQAILLLVGHWYEHREAVLTGTVAREMPLAVQALLWPFRFWTF